MSSRIQILLLLVLALTIYIAPFRSVVAEKIFVVGVEDNYYLPHYAFEYGEYTGYARELFDAFFNAQGYAHEYRAFPVERLFHSLIDGQIDFKYPDNEFWRPDIKQDSPIAYSNAVAVYIDGISVLPANLGQKTNEIKALATVRGFSAPPWIYRIADGEIQLVENDSFQGLVEQALIGRVDGVYANVDVVSYLLENTLQQPGALEFDTSMPYSQGNYRLSTLKHPTVIDELNQWLHQHADFVHQLKKKYRILTISKLKTKR